ncbi:MAG: TauD/TfdA family dioxygenase [Rhodospirillales bacterium]
MDVRPCTAVLGAEILGVDVAHDLDADTFAAVERAYDDFGVIFFRDQTVSPERQIAFSRRFGTVDCFPLAQYCLAEHPEILLISNVKEQDRNIGLADAGQTWHTDMSWSAVPPRGSALYAVEIPAKDGVALGATLFASAAAAYDALPEDMKRRIDGLKAVHSYQAKHAYRAKVSVSERDAMTNEQKNAHPDVVHPIVRTHPITGRKCLYVMTGECTGIVGMNDKEALPLLDELAAHVVEPAFQYKHVWRTGDLLMWDNCTVQHFAVRDYAWPMRRLMHRTQFAGSVPF